MESENLKIAKKTITHWYLPLILGTALVITGIRTFITPVSSYLTYATLFAVTFLCTSVLEMISALVNQKGLANRGWSLAAGIIDLAIGALLLSQPEITMNFLVNYIGIAMVFRSVFSISRSIELQKHKIQGWKSLLMLGMLGIAGALLILWQPFVAGITIGFYISFSFVIVGIFEIFFSFRLRKLKRLVEFEQRKLNSGR